MWDDPDTIGLFVTVFATIAVIALAHRKNRQSGDKK